MYAHLPPGATPSFVAKYGCGRNSFVVMAEGSVGLVACGTAARWTVKWAAENAADIVTSTLE
jgi:hypothetical protein